MKKCVELKKKRSLYTINKKWKARDLRNDLCIMICREHDVISKIPTIEVQEVHFAFTGHHRLYSCVQYGFCRPGSRHA